MRIFLKKFAKFLLGIAIPLFLLFISYIYYDPFKVVNHYDSYYTSNTQNLITLNRDYVSVETFLNNNPNYHYDSFIFGNSRSRFFEMNTWSSYINSDRCFHFDASGESLYGIYKKFEFLEERQTKINNALILFDYSTLKETKNSKGHLFIKHWRLSNQSRIDFHLEFFKAYCSYRFLPAYLDFRLSGKIKDYMIKGHLLGEPEVDYNLKFNEVSFLAFEKLIKFKPTDYYNNDKMKLFYKRNSIQKFSPKVINEEQVVMLKSIKRILDKHHANFKIIINPLYDQLKIDTTDLKTLKQIFGINNVFDFSGINSITVDYKNYYEESHYRPQVSAEILKVIYSPKIKNNSNQ